MKKPLPRVTWQNIAPPYLDYDYFQGGGQFPFHPQAERFDLTNAWWLCEAAALVYADEAFVRPRFELAGLPEIRYFDGPSTDCFVASNDTMIWVVFRGTESQKRTGKDSFEDVFADVKADCNVLLVPFEQGGSVHKGFRDALDEVREELSAYLKALHQPPRTLWITGHSLGAALATLAAAGYDDVQGVYTFGSPRVGNAQFKNAFPVRMYRVEYNNDVVTAVPPPGLYRHVGELWYIDSEGQLHHGTSRLEIWKDGVMGEMRNIARSFEQVKQGDFTYIPGGIKDHVPLLYAVHLWNNLVEQIER